VSTESVKCIPVSTTGPAISGACSFQAFTAAAMVVQKRRRPQKRPSWERRTRLHARMRIEA
ncbi:MAG: hypothetical protein KDB22_26840, partial [Planctomycetales bacterium]|nr:hypothetical protein [Planctomycetales bacterium]